MVGVGAGRPEQQQRAGSSWFSDIGVSVRAWARNACGPLLAEPPCAEYKRRTPEPPASSTSGTNLFASVAIAIYAVARQAVPRTDLRSVFSRWKKLFYGCTHLCSLVIRTNSELLITPTPRTDKPLFLQKTRLIQTLFELVGCRRGQDRFQFGQDVFKVDQSLKTSKRRLTPHT